MQLKTNCGGGKTHSMQTHSMLALYHLFGGAAPGDLAGVDTVLAEAGVKTPPRANRVVLVGNKISPGNPVTKKDGTIVRTLWGELAWQLGGPKAFARIAKDDEHATSPGDVLRELFVEYGPCLVLVDEWVAYARQLHDQSDLSAGSFETQFTFAHCSCRTGSASARTARADRRSGSSRAGSAGCGRPSPRGCGSPPPSDAARRACAARLLKSLARVQLLILDDWGLSVLTEAEQRDLLEILEDRHQRASTIVTSQLLVDQWCDATPSWIASSAQPTGSR